MAIDALHSLTRELNSSDLKSKWRKVKLGEICQFSNGGTPDRSVGRYFEGTIPWITSADLADGAIEDARFYITQEAIESSATKLISKNNILLVTRTGVGKVAINTIDVCISQDFTAIIPYTPFKG